MCVCVFVCVYACMCMCMCVCVFMHVCVCVCVCVCQTTWCVIYQLTDHKNISSAYFITPHFDECMMSMSLRF